MGDVSGEAKGLFAIKDGVSPFFAAAFKKNIEVAILPERIKKIDFIRRGMIEKPKNLHSTIMPQTEKAFIILSMMNEWKDLFERVKEEPYSASLHAFLEDEYASHTIYPPRDLVFQAFRLTSPKDLKVVIIGQDPYHNPGQAMGLSFSVPQGIEPPPSLINIYKEIENDLGIKMNRNNGDLTPWARQGVLLLNAYLTVRAGQPLSHNRVEYEKFIKDVMVYLDELDQPIVFMLWGSFAKRYIPFIHNPKHAYLTAVHPSPLSANRGGWFNRHLFSECNAILEKGGVSPIDWKIE